MRIAIINRDRCQPRKCSKECEYFCPPVRTGDETIVFADGKPLITENLCVGCGICVRKCPFGAITITNLPPTATNHLSCLHELTRRLRARGPVEYVYFYLRPGGYQAVVVCRTQDVALVRTALENP